MIDVLNKMKIQKKILNLTSFGIWCWQNNKKKNGFNNFFQFLNRFFFIFIFIFKKKEGLIDITSIFTFEKSGFYG